MESEKKYIAVDVLRSVLNTEIADVVATYTDYEESGFSRDALNEIIDNIPKEDVAHVIHAKWRDNITCSNCNYYEEDAHGHIIMSGHKKFCAGCGATMDLEVEF